MKFNGDFTMAMKNFVKEKMEKFSEYVDYSEATVAYKTLKSGEFKVEISIGDGIRASGVGHDFYEIVLDVVEKLESQIKRYRSSKSYSNNPLNILDFESADDGGESTISKEKLIFLDEISYIEAIDDMELLGHAFYIYKDADKKRTCVVYKRYDGTYGLIECR